MKNSLANLYEKEATRKVLASLISILIGLLVGAVVVIIVGLTKKTIGLSGHVAISPGLLGAILYGTLFPVISSKDFTMSKTLYPVPVPRL